LSSSEMPFKKSKWSSQITICLGILVGLRNVSPKIGFSFINYKEIIIPKGQGGGF
jgi:hypothetical protein